PLKKSRLQSTDGAAELSQAHAEMLPPSEPSDVAMSYLMIMHDHRGKFLPKIAKELGVTPGPAYSKLSAGETVTTAAGRVVYPSEVMTETKLGTGIAVCDLPDSSYIEDFLAKPEWKNADELQKRISCFFWILGKEVHEDPRL